MQAQVHTASANQLPNAVSTNSRRQTTGVARMRETVSALGKLASIGYPVVRCRTPGILALRVKPVIDLLGGRAADAGNDFEIGETGAFDRTCRAEVMQQRFFSAGPDTR